MAPALREDLIRFRKLQFDGGPRDSCGPGFCTGFSLRSAVRAGPCAAYLLQLDKAHGVGGAEKGRMVRRLRVHYRPGVYTLGEERAGIRICFPDHVRCAAVESEIVLVDVKRRIYFGLDEFASRVWNLLREDSSLEHAIQRLLLEYRVSPKVLRLDISELIQKLESKGLVEIRCGSAISEDPREDEVS